MTVAPAEASVALGIYYSYIEFSCCLFCCCFFFLRLFIEWWMNKQEISPPLILWYLVEARTIE